MSSGIAEDTASFEEFETFLTVIIKDLAVKILWCVLNYYSARKDWIRLRSGNASKTIVSKLRILYTLVGTKLCTSLDIEDHNAARELLLARLPVIGSLVE